MNAGKKILIVILVIFIIFDLYLLFTLFKNKSLKKENEKGLFLSQNQAFNLNAGEIKVEEASEDFFGTITFTAKVLSKAIYDDKQEIYLIPVSLATKSTIYIVNLIIYPDLKVAITYAKDGVIKDEQHWIIQDGNEVIKMLDVSDSVIAEINYTDNNYQLSSDKCDEICKSIIKKEVRYFKSNSMFLSKLKKGEKINDKPNIGPLDRIIIYEK